MLISRLLKGVVAVSDVVFIKDGDGNGNYYSYKLPLEHAPQIPDIKEQMNRAYIEELICCAVFTDYDHGVGELRKDMHNFTSGNKNFTFFDFDQATYFWRYAGQKVAHAALRIKHHIGTDGVKVFVQKLDELEDRFRSSFLQDVVASIEKNNGDIPVIIKEAPGDNKIESFRQEVLRRIIELKTALESNPSNN